MKKMNCLLLKNDKRQFYLTKQRSAHKHKQTQNTQHTTQHTKTLHIFTTRYITRANQLRFYIGFVRTSFIHAPSDI